MTGSSSPRPSSSGATGGGQPALDVFALRDSVVAEYERFATSFTTIHAPDIRQQVAAIYAESRYWPEPLIQINPSYKRSKDVSTLVADRVLHPGCADIFCADGQPLSLYKHQEQAIALAAEGESFVVTTGVPGPGSRSASSSPSSATCWPHGGGVRNAAPMPSSSTR